mmetsp:Transcript_24526/g.35662  ORF Transcript_24526/g.35662 Transcript_24526/m.35662 type:complete len:258 (+) Transcript_24526:47-820(+)
MKAAVSAEHHLKALINDIRHQSPRTLAFWRVTYEPIYNVLQAFAATDDKDAGKEKANSQLLLTEFQTFLDQLNPLLSQQEKNDADYINYKYPARKESSNKNTTGNSKELSVVFGGKLSDGLPHSISEMLVARLLTVNTYVFTVSRSTISYPLPNNTSHIAKQFLDDDEKGFQDFMDVMKLATTKWNSSENLVFYFTLGQHLGENPFCRNLAAAKKLLRGTGSDLIFKSKQELESCFDRHGCHIAKYPQKFRIYYSQR